MDYTLYDSSGRLGLQMGFCSQESADLNLAGKTYMVGAHDAAEKYVLDGEVLPRPVMGITITEATLTGLPIPATVRIGTETYEVDDGDVELDIPMAGTYTVSVEAWPYQDWQTEITV